MNAHLFAAGVTAALTACGPRVISNPKADADVVFYAGTEPVAVGSALTAMVTWDGWCERPSIGVEGGGGVGAGPCNEVPHTVTFRCDDDACTWKATGGRGYALLVTKPGALRAVAIVTPKGGAARTYPLASVEVVVPDTATIGCARMGDDLMVGVELSHTGRPVQASAPRLIVNGAACTYNAPLGPGELSLPMTSLDYTCRGAPADVKAEVMTADYRLVAAAHCAPSPGATD